MKICRKNFKVILPSIKSDMYACSLFKIIWYIKYICNTLMYINLLYLGMDKKLLKGSLSTIVLELIRRDGSMYGYEITQKVRRLSDGQIRITEGALYPTLHKLEQQEFLSTRTEIVDGRARKYYYVTEEGAKENEKRLKDTADFIIILRKVLQLE